jgi:PAS domain S-box-containing protein
MAIKEYSENDFMQEISVLKDEIQALKSEKSKLIEELLQTKNELEKSKNLFNYLDSNVPAFIAYVNSDTLVYEFVNETFEKGFGLPKEKIIGAQVKDIIGEENFKFALNYINQVKEGKSCSYVNEFKLISGIRYIKVNYRPIFNDSGNVVAIVVLSYDITEQRNSELKLLESEERLGRAEKTAKIGNWTLDLNTKIMSPSSGAKEIYGVYNEIIQLEEIRHIPLSEYRDLMDKSLRELITENKPYDLEFRIKRPSDGKIVDIHSLATYDKENNIVFGVIHDVTERKNNEKELQINEENLNTLFNAISESVFLTDTNSNIITCNETFAARLGHSVSDCIGKSIYSLIPEEVVENRKKIIDSVILNGEPVTFQDFRLNRWIQHNIWPIKDQDGNVSRIVIYARDITAQKEAEDVLNESYRFYNQIINCAKEGIIVYDKDLRYKLWNPFMEELSGLKSEEIIGKNPEDLFPFLSSNGVIECVKRALNGKICEELEFEFNLPNGKSGWTSDKIAPIYNSLGEIIGAISTITNITESKIALKTIQENQFWLLESQRIGSIGSYSLDITSGIWKSSITLDKIFGIDDSYPKDVIGWDNLVHPSQKEEMLNYFVNDVIGKKSYFNKEYKIVRVNDHEARWVLGRGELKFDESGNPIQMLGTIQDITERKLAEEKLIESENKFSNYVNYAQHGIFISNEFGEYTDVNPAASKITGYSIEELLSMKVIDLIPEEFRNQAFKHFTEVNTYGFASGEMPFKRKDNTIRYWAVDAVKISDSILLGFVIDITDRKINESKLLESESRFRKIYQDGPFGVVLADYNFYFIIVNPIFCKIIGYSEAELLTMKLNDITYPDDLSKDMINVKKLLNKEISVYKTEKRYIQKNGNIIWGSLTLTSVYNDDDMFLYHLGIVEDITLRKQSELLLSNQKNELEAQYEEFMQLNEILHHTNTSLQIAKDKAEESDLLKTAFLQNMSHEIRTPLNGIIGFSNLLSQEDITKEDIKEYTSIIQQSGFRLLEIVNNVLDISKIETGQVEINYQSFSINQLIENLYSFFLPFAKEKHLDLKFMTHLKDSFILSDETKLTQILTNLINNSIKFTTTGSIEFGYKISENTIKFYVSDTGIGIPNDMQKRIFDRFFQAELAISKGYEGAGLGLTICKGLIELMGGDIWVESIQNAGTTFFFNIPLIVATFNDYPIVENIQDKVSSRKKKIIIAEDDWTSYQYLLKILKNHDIIVLYADNGKKALELVIANDDIDLILMDIKMPIMDGIEATKQIKVIRPDLPIIAQTAFAFSSEKEKILSIGCDDYISKPITKDKLLAIFNKYII